MTCKFCSENVINISKELCKKHLLLKRLKKRVLKQKILKRTILDLKKLYPNKSPSKYIRSYARSHYKNLTKKPCASCGYPHHVELCHIKAICTFPDTATVAEINSKNNIVQLCPNCHWELDNMFLTKQ